MGLSGDVSWPPLFSVSCFLRYFLMHFVARIIESTFDTSLMASSSTSEGFKQRSRWKLISSTSFCSPTTVHWTLLPKSTCKTEVMHQPAPRKPFVEPNVTINGQWQKVVEKFPYIGNTLTKSIVMDNEVKTRLAKTSVAFGWLNRNVGSRRGISEATKIKVYRAVVLTPPLLWPWNVDNLSTAYKEAKPLSLSGDHMAKVHPWY